MDFLSPHPAALPTGHALFIWIATYSSALWNPLFLLRKQKKPEQCDETSAKELPALPLQDTRPAFPHAGMGRRIAAIPSSNGTAPLHFLPLGPSLPSVDIRGTLLGEFPQLRPFFDHFKQDFQRFRRGYFAALITRKGIDSSAEHGGGLLLVEPELLSHAKEVVCPLYVYCSSRTSWRTFALPHSGQIILQLLKRYQQYIFNPVEAIRQVVHPHQYLRRPAGREPMPPRSAGRGGRAGFFCCSSGLRRWRTAQR